MQGLYLSSLYSLNLNRNSVCACLFESNCKCSSPSTESLGDKARILTKLKLNICSITNWEAARYRVRET